MNITKCGSLSLAEMQACRQGYNSMSTGQHRGLVMLCGPYMWFAVFCTIVGLTLSALDSGLEGAALAIIGFGPLYYRLDRLLTPRLLLGPLTLAYSSHILGYAIGPVGWVHFVDMPTTFFVYEFMLGQWAAVAGLAIFVFVYVPVFRYFASNLLGVDEPKNVAPSLLKTFVAISLSIAAIFIFMGFLSGTRRRLGAPVQLDAISQGLAASFQDIIFIAWFFLAYSAVCFGRKWILGWSILFGAFTLFTILDGSRGPVITAALMSAIGAGYAGVPRTKLMFLLLVMVLFIGPIATIVYDYRNDYYGGELSLVDRAVQFAPKVGGVLSNLSTNIGDFADTIFWQSTAHTVDSVIRLTPTYTPYVGLQDLDRLPYVFVPRAFAPNRPNIDDAGEIACTYAQLINRVRSSDERCGKGDYTPAVADGYRRFGWIGVALIYTFHACVYGLAIAYCWKRRNNLVWLAMSVYLLLSIQLMWTNTLLGMLYRLSFSWPKYLLFFWLVNKFAVFIVNTHRAKGFS